MFMNRFFPGGHFTSGRIPDRGQQGALPVPPLIVASSGVAVWGSAATPPSGSDAGGVISGPPHPPPPLVPVPAHTTADNNIDDGNKRRLPFPVPPQAGFYISDLLYRGGGIWALRRGAASPGVVAARRREEAGQADGRRTSAPASPVSERRPGSTEGGDDGGSKEGSPTTTTTTTTTTSSHKLKFGIDRILAKESPKPVRSPTQEPCPCGPTARVGGCLSCTSSPAAPYLLPGTHLPRLPPSSTVLHPHHLHPHHLHHHHHHHHQHHQQHHQHQHHGARPQHQHQHQGGSYLYRSADFPGPYSVLACDGSSRHQQHQPNNSQQPPHQPGTGSTGKRKRSWSRAVFSHLQRKGLEKRFEVQKYVTKPDRRQLAGLLNLTDAQVKVWFQNRRMKWRHAEEAKRKKDESQQNQELLRQNSEKMNQEEDDSSDSDIEVTDSPNKLQ